MPNKLCVSIGSATDKGPKKINQDFHGSHVPKEPALTSKGIAIALADGISSSDVSQYASETSIKSFLEDYYCTPDSWTVKTSVQRVLKAANSWLYLQTRNSPYRFSPDRGYVCTFSTLVIKSNTAHIFHAGDTRIYRLSGAHLEQMTEDHRLWVSKDQSYLRRALGMKDQLELDYRSVSLESNDVFILATDGVYEFASEKFMIETINQYRSNLDEASKVIVDEAIRQGSDDNLSIQIITIDELPEQEVSEVYDNLTSLPFPPELRARMEFDGYEIIRELHKNHRSHIYLAVDTESKEQVVLKAPSVDLRNNNEYLERFLLEEWVARRINNAHVLKPCQQTRKRNYLYTTAEFIKGQTLSQWMLDNTEPDIEAVRSILEQIAIGLRAFHRQEMLHQDIRPENIMIDETGTVKIIDFGSTRVAGLSETNSSLNKDEMLGTLQYSAPEYFLGEPGTPRSDMFSLGVIAYQMLSGRLPYGTSVARSTTKAAQRKLAYQSVLDDERTIPAWIDEAIRKAVHPNPLQRYEEISEFIFDLRQPNKSFASKYRPPLMERNPLLFWKLIAIAQLVIIIYLIYSPATTLQSAT